MRFSPRHTINRQHALITRLTCSVNGDTFPIDIMLNLYTETAVETNPATTASRVEFSIPRKNGTYNKSKYSVRPPRGDTLASDEKSFAERYLASSSSFYFRQTKHYPRTFLWRVLAEQKVLEITPADLSRPEKDQKEACVTLSFEFQDPILPFGVTFADPLNGNELHVFVCTNKSEIFNFRLPIDFFNSSSDIPQDIAKWCQPVEASSLHIDTVYQLYASSPYELFVTFTGGRILALRRKADSDTWSQDYYDDSTWGGTIRGLVSRRGQQYIEYGAGRLALTTPQGMVASPDTTYLYTLCLNHTLRVWHLPSGKLVDSRDLLDVTREQNERLQISPAEPGLIRLIKFPKDNHHTLVTYTPHDGGQLKFWALKGGLTSPLTVEDKFPHARLNPPDPDPTGNTIWSVTGLEITPGNELVSPQIWVLWRNNNHHQLYTMHFDIGSLNTDWKTNWVSTATGSNRSNTPDLVLIDGQDITKKWLDFLFFPGRYSRAVLETALSRYQEITAAKLESSIKNKPLKERLCSVIASSVILRKYEGTEIDYDRFNTDTDHQWRNYWRILEPMNESRHAPLSLAYDTFSGMAWMTMTDMSSAIRECSRSELLEHNIGSELSESDDLIAARWSHRKVSDDIKQFETTANIIQASRRFRKSFPPDLSHEFLVAIEEELYSESTIAAPEKIILIFNQVGFADKLSEGIEQQLASDLESIGGIDGLTNDLIYSILKLLSNISSKKPKTSLKSTIFGSSILSTALLDDVMLARDILLDLLVLIIFIDESSSFDPPELFEQVIITLQEQERNLWLLTHFRSTLQNSPGQSINGNKNNTIEANQSNERLVSIMEELFMQSVRPQPAVDRPMMYILTDMVAETQKWASGRDAVSQEDAVVHIQCFLIAHGEIDLATDFLKFQPSTPWSVYVKGRLRLIRSEYNEAAHYFRKAAYTLACGKAIGDIKEMSAGLLSILDTGHFNNGLPQYFQHVMTLFEEKKAYVQTSEFGRLCLQAIVPGHKEPSHRFRSEVLSRLFTSELSCANFEAAYETLVQFSDLALQKSSAVSLINAILDPRTSIMSASSALDLLQGLPWSLHPQLATQLDQHLTTLAKKQNTVPGSGTYWTSSSTVDYLSILHALRLSKQDYRGATTVLFDRLRVIQRSGRARSDPQATSLRHALLALINTMTCVSPDEAYILADINDDPRHRGIKRGVSQQDKEKPNKRKRIIITLDDLRHEYQQVLDRCSRIERGDFEFDRGDESEDDEGDEGDTIVNGSKLYGHGDTMEM